MKSILEKKTFREAAEEGNKMNINPELPHQRRPPARLDNGQAPVRWTSPKQYHKQEYNETIYYIGCQLESRFNQPEIKNICKIAGTPYECSQWNSL